MKITASEKELILKRRKVHANLSIEKILNAYLEAMLWAEMDDEGEPLDKNYKVKNIDAKAIQDSKKDITTFYNRAKEMIEEAGISEEDVGHKFWLNRNGHGTGFWDMEDVDKNTAKKLSDLSKSFGEITPYVGDDNKIYLG